MYNNLLVGFEEGSATASRVLEYTDPKARDAVLREGALDPSALLALSTLEGFDHIENRAAVDAVMRADVAQGRPAPEATGAAPSEVPKARPTRGSTQWSPKTQRTVQSR